MAPLSIRRTWWRWRRRACESIGISRYSRPGLNGLDRRLERWVDFDGGFFIEAGANDGFEQSNTYYFERFRGWTGILIEPVPELAQCCARHRPRSHVLQAALVEAADPGATVTIHRAGLMSMVAGAFGDEAAETARLELARQVQRLEVSRPVEVPARTLSGIIDATGLDREIDLLSLDVEGAELKALAGLDLDRHAPRFICVESRDPEAVIHRLAGRYDLAEILTDAGSYRDLLLLRR